MRERFLGCPFSHWLIRHHLARGRNTDIAEQKTAFLPYTRHRQSSPGSAYGEKKEKKKNIGTARGGPTGRFYPGGDF